MTFINQCVILLIFILFLPSFSSAQYYIEAELLHGNVKNDTVGQAIQGSNGFLSDTVIIRIKDLDGNNIIDPEADVYLRSTNKGGFVVGVGGGHFISPFYDRTVSAYRDTLKAYWDAADECFKYDLGNVAYNRAVKIYFKACYGNKNSDTKQYHIFYETKPYQLFLEPEKIAASLNPGEFSPVITAIVKDSFRNVSRHDYILVTTHSGKGTFEYTSDPGRKNNTSKTAEEEVIIKLNNSGKAYFKLLIAEGLNSDSLIVTVFNRETIKPYPASDHYRLLRKAIYVEVKK